MRTADIECRAQKELWEREYRELQVIPSSTRTLPSKALVACADSLGLTAGDQVLDVGCGNGRNSVYLAELGGEVQAVDFSQTALTRLDHLVSRTGLGDRIHPYSAVVTKRLPFKDGTFPVVVDSYVFCHFVEDAVKARYLNELYRVTKPGGRLFLSLFSPGDAYYRPMLTTQDPERMIITDPNNGITKQLFTEVRLRALFRRAFSIRRMFTVDFDDIVLGRCYRRRILAVILRK